MRDSPNPNGLASASGSGTANPTQRPPATFTFPLSNPTVVGYDGQHWNAHGSFGTPAQLFGAPGMFDPSKPFGDLAAPVFMNQLYQAALFSQNERLYMLQRLQELKAQGMSPPTEELEKSYPWFYDDLRGTQLEPPSWALYRSLHHYIDDERGLLVAMQEGVPIGGGISSMNTTQPTPDLAAGQTDSSSAGGCTSADPLVTPLSPTQESGEASRSSVSASQNLQARKFAVAGCREQVCPKTHHLILPAQVGHCVHPHVYVCMYK